MKATWDIFCSVVDNYGDIGVTWRLARQLVAEHGLAVRLWVDDLNAFTPMCPGADATAPQQWQHGVDVRQWPVAWLPVAPADVVIGAFACQLPAAYVEAMRARVTPPLWLNLEYLSAEDWVEGCHGLPSPQPNGLRKVFFFPGFTEKTGGLLREGSLLARRDAFQQGARQAFLQGLGVNPEAGALLISLFAYENPQLGNWLEALASGEQPCHLLVPQGRVVAGLGQWLGEAVLQVGSVRKRGALTLQVLPFVSQDDYDRLLWSCDFNAVRGEDSFVRAQWAGRADAVAHLRAGRECPLGKARSVSRALSTGVVRRCRCRPRLACGVPGTWTATWARPGRQPVSTGRNCSSMPGFGRRDRPLSRTLPQR
ncbi:hypothetical protein PPS11_40038 [Pseudomonas putida S11]|nr:hypothetical protein PPS11_40038 [Pseudomonas putida S11]